MINISNTFFKKLNLYAVTFLVTFGLLLQISASSVQGLNQYGDNFYFIKRHLASLVIGIIIFNLGKSLSYKFILKFSNILIVGITISLFLVLAYGVVRGGSRRWIDLGPVLFQPSEYAKPIIILWVAYKLSEIKNDTSQRHHLQRAIILPLTCCFLIYLEPDYGTTLTILSIFFIQIVFSNIKIRYPALILSLSVFPLYLFANASDYRRQRIETFLTGKCQDGVDLLGDCFQLNQSWIALSSGGLTGLGPGTSRARWGMLPNAYTDFIISITGEEYGFIGIVVLTLVFLILIISFYGMAVTTSDNFKKLILAGMATWVGIQTILNLGGAVGLLPITGIVLPFISYGGTAMVSIFIGLSFAHNETSNNE
tara:strand:+ start:6596 stop:7699 length:1104 start_codon:yes stop_codon:yes gene_type:complete